jgi:hypothetical protein
MNNPSIFIGSSSEGLPVAHAVKEHLSDFEVFIWNEGVFQVNQSYLESLIRAADLFDFALLCLTPDDVTVSRGEEKDSPRDNVLFELGLFMGRLGRVRAFIVCDDAIRILSDFAGITIGMYRRPEDGDYVTAVEKACSLIRAQIELSLSQSGLSFLPSTALAIGYYENFVLKVRDALVEEKEIRIDSQPIEYSEFLLRILVPRKLAELDPGNLKKRVKHLRAVTLETSFRDFPFYVYGDYTPGESDVLELLDIPTTLCASERIIELILKRESIGKSFEKDKLESKEINNFKKALESLTENYEDIRIEWL